MSYSEPLAKPGEAPTPLATHLGQVAEYARAAAEACRPHWERVLTDEWAEIVEQALVIAALTHDLGKAADGFQRALCDRKFRWEFRHEILSAALLLTAAQPDDELMELVIAAVLTHHRDLSDPQLCKDGGWVALPMPEVEQDAVAKFQAKASELRAHWEWLQRFCHQQTALNSFCLPSEPEDLLLPARFLERLKQTLRDQSLLQDARQRLCCSRAAGSWPPITPSALASLNSRLHCLCCCPCPHCVRHYARSKEF
ncbi:MAG: CRISPR-associated endonuclease Cas3'' [Candidatus Acetothermia bacterium]|jgi:CRISPR-associated endonuclease/helicase Cas3|nr:CRISPR-associated endonuclease Cas3'' [Candidatus Acetothermia bacterium]MDH7504730.1 CRISPR-associated endonuclease Cas3'' [Candidatus Acetothermia bacterium]